MSQRQQIINRIDEELALLESEAMDKADGKGVQSREVHKDPAPSKSEKKKGFKLTGGGQTVGGDSGGITESAMDTADGQGVASSDPQQVSGTDSSGGHDNGDCGMGASETEKMPQSGQGVASKNAKKSSVSGSKDGKAIEKADGQGVASPEDQPDGMKNDGVKEGRVIVLPHDVVVEHEGKKKTLEAGTKIVIGEEFETMDYDEDEEETMDYDGEEDMDYDGEAEIDMDVSDDMVDMADMPDMDADIDVVDDADGVSVDAEVEEPIGHEDADIVAAVVSAVLKALHGGGDYDYAMEGKEISLDAILEDTKKILEGDKKRQGKVGKQKSYGQKGKSKSYGEMEDEDEVEECMEDKEKEFGSSVKEEHDYDYDNNDNGENDIDKSSPDYIAALIDDIDDDFDALKDALGTSDEDEDEEMEMEYDDEDEVEEAAY